MLGKNESGKIGCLGMVFLGFIAIYIIGQNTDRSSNHESVSTHPLTDEEIRKEKLSKYFSSWDGSHGGLEKIIIKTMHDPSSYDHVKTIYWDMGNHLVVKTTFKGTNAFGGVVTNSIKAKVDLQGRVIEILSK